MKTLKLAGVCRSLRAIPGAWLFGAAMAMMGAAQAAPVEIQVWHTLSDSNRAEFEKLAKQYNKEQNDVQVVLRGFASPEALIAETTNASKKKAGPNLFQLDDNHSPEVIAQHKAVLPLYQLLNRYPIKDLKWFIPATSNFIRDDKGRMLAFPWMAEMPIMFYNIEHYKKAGLNPAKPARTWSELQVELLKLRDVAKVSCPYATSDQVAVHVENLAPINNQMFLSNKNGQVNAKTAPAMQFDTLYMRHLSLMVSWKRSDLFTANSSDRSNDALFAKGACSVLTTGSGALGSFLNTKSLSFGVAPLPFYDQATKVGGRPFVSGSALWAMDGRPKEEEKAAAQFLAWLSKPVIAAQWHQRTGFLPLTDAAFRASDVSFYDRIPGAQMLVDNMSAVPTETSRGFRLTNYSRIEPVLNQQLNDALEGKTPPVAALNNASSQARAIGLQR